MKDHPPHRAEAGSGFAPPPRPLRPRSFRTSLHLQLWLVVLFAVLPVLLMALWEYRTQRQEASAQIRLEMQRAFAVAARSEQSAMENVAGVLKTMAQSDDLRTLDAQQCRGIALRLRQVFTDYANLGAALPDGRVFCSAQPGSVDVSVADRRWFRDTLDSTQVTGGEYVFGRISGMPGMVFGYPLRAPDGTLRAALFASIQLEWFDKLIASFNLPPGWRATLIGADGRELKRGDDNTPGTSTSGFRFDFGALTPGHGEMVERTDADGERRLYGVAPVSFADTKVFLVVGAPAERSLSGIERRFWFKLAIFLGLGVLSALMARLYIYRLFEAWTRKVMQAIGRIGDGDLETRLDMASGVRELDSVESGINRMAASLYNREAELRRLSMAVEQSPESIVITDTEGHIEYVNDAFTRISGYAREEVIGNNTRMLKSEQTPRAVFDELWQTLVAGGIWRGEFVSLRKDGSTYLELATIAPVRDSGSRVSHYVAIKQDVTQLREWEHALHQLAYTDALTGLPNRLLLQDRLSQAIVSSARAGLVGALLLLDIDRFKLLNETQGHAIGDQVLQTLAQRLRSLVGEEDTVARHGDDDFAVVIAHLPADLTEAAAQVERVVRRLHEGVSLPLTLNDGEQRHVPTICVGVALFNSRTVTTGEVLQQAEMAMHAAKATGRGQTRFYRPDMQALVESRASIEFGLRDALANNELEIFYQVQQDVGGAVIGAEALLRWRRADGRMVSPGEFIPVAEDSGLIVPIGLWVLQSAARLLARWQQHAHTRHWTLSVNVSARQFHEPDFVASVEQTLTEHGVPGPRLCLELTESVFMGDLAVVAETMKRLRRTGVKFSIDDFGTGYSSLSYLSQLPFDELKIDQSFTRTMQEDAGSRSIALAILGMCRSLALRTLAEGVETVEQRDFLAANDCEAFQGYLLGRPMPLAQFEQSFITDVAAAAGGNGP